MDSPKLLIFDSNVGTAKAKSIIDKKNGICPFCDYRETEQILDCEGEILLVKNKYPILQNTFPTVLIETNDCHGELSIYPKKHLYKVIRFGLKHWFRMQESGEYKSVVFFKNHGPESGGTIRHPHMQIIGLKNLDYMDFGTTAENFKGILVHKMPGVELNLSTYPRMGFYEFNVILDDLKQIDRFSDCIQATTHFLLNVFQNCHSYNIFFYQLDDMIAAKIIPRFVTSPLFVGYSIPQITTKLEAVADSLRRRYFSY